MTRTRKWMVAIATCVIAAVAFALWFSIEFSKCVYRESEPAYSSDRRFYSQMQFTICQNHAKSHVSLVIGAPGKKEKTVLLEMGPEIGAVNVSWHEGPELHVQVRESAITKRYGPYEDLPPIIVTNP